MRAVSSSPLVSHRSVSLLAFAVIVAASFLVTPAAAQESPQAVVSVRPPLITQPVDETRMTVLKGNTHPLARREFDIGTAPATLPMQRMLLVLKRSDEQEHSLRKLLDDQQDKNSPNYHKWVTPEQFGAQFGPTDGDLQIITSWLQSHGFQVGTTKGRTVLEFSGSASQVQEAFHTSIHAYVVNGEQHWANASDPSIPTALTGAVRGVLTMHNFISKPASHFVSEPAMAQIVQKGSKPVVTFPAQGGQPAINALAPQDYAVIYNLRAPAYTSLTGLGIVIGVVGRNDLYNSGQDVQNFHGEVGDGMNVFGGANLNIVLDGPDPGNAGGGEEAEATLDTTWSSAIAPGATVDFVLSGTTNTTDGIDLSELYIIENNLTDIMTESFSSCEYFETDAQLQGISALAEQAAAQGITYFVSAGDNGAEGCDAPSNPPATGPVSVNALASTPFTVAVGGTMFNENGNPSQYWTSSAPISESAISYIPENVWNESSLTNGLWAGSGGASSGNLGDAQVGGTTGGVPKPSWQFGTGLNIPQDGVRDLPDVSLTAAGHDPYLLCFEGSCVPNSQNQIYVYFISGTSASAPSFAGIMALVDQSAGGRQGQANYVFYQLAASQATAKIYPGTCNGSNTAAPPATTCIFNDVTVGNNVVPGEVGSSYAAGPGYDLASGLGSVNVANLITNWSTVKFNATTTTLTVSPTTITHGQQLTVTAKVTANSGTPTGDVVLHVRTSPAAATAATLDLFSLNSGQASGTTNAVPGSAPGNFTSVSAHYSGDGTFASSDSAPVNITVNPEGSTTNTSLQAFDPNGNLVSSPFPFGSLIFVRADIVGKSGFGTPTGTVTFTDTCGGSAACPLPSSNPQVSPPVAVISNPTLNSMGNASLGDGIVSFDAGNHSVAVTYSGDTSFTSSSSAAPVAFTVQPGFLAVSGPTDVVITSPGLSGTSNIGLIASTGFSTAISFTCSGLPSEATCSSSQATGQGPTNVVVTSITVTTTAAHTVMLHSDTPRYYYAMLLGGGLPFVGVLFIGGKRQRWMRLFGLTLLMALLVAFPGCGGGGGSTSHQDPGTPAGTSTVTVTATAGSTVEQGTFTLVVQ